MKKYLSYLSCLLISLLGLSCVKKGAYSEQDGVNAEQSEMNKLEQVREDANELLGEGLKMFENDSHTAALAFSSYLARPASAFESVRYAVYDLRTAEMISSGTITRGKVSWISDTEIEIISYPGRVKSRNIKTNYERSIYNIITRTQKKTVP